MIFRKTTAADMPDVSLVSGTAFESPFDPTERVDWDKRLAENETGPFNRGNLCWRDRWGAFDEKTGGLAATIQCITYPMRLNGHRIAMSGIGGVATLPEYRRQGAIRGCFENAFREMHQRGILLSQLYPFSDAFYRQFGYENMMRVCRWEIGLNAIKPFPVTGRMEAFRVGGDTAPYVAVHEAMDARFELSSIREPVDWKPFSLQNPTKTLRYTYLYRAGDGTPKGYLTFAREGRVLNCEPGFGSLLDFQFADAEGLMGLLNFVKTYASYADTLRIILPEGLDIEPMLHMHNDLQVTRFFRGEGRVIDAEQALRLSRYRGSGEARIGITDPMCPWNEGIWALRYENNAAVSVTHTEAKPDVELTIQDFTRLIFGALSADDLWLLPGAKVYAPEKLQDVFLRRRTWLSELF